MYRPTAKKSEHGNYYFITIPSNDRRDFLVDVAKHLSNSDKAIQVAVKIAKEAENGSVSEATIRDFEFSLGLISAWTICLDEKSAQGFANELNGLLTPSTTTTASSAWELPNRRTETK